MTNLLQGTLLCVVIAGIATFLGGLKIGSVSLEVIGAPVFAILMGMLLTLVKPQIAASPKNKDSSNMTINP